ncbi:unnamed protein product [marine sediment metagenome]|uniref:Uncharacterized protein n=1 Tax=marine sediment metagenome TaxID=412755 RepID=X1Q109_9ZZZZ
MTTGTKKPLAQRKPSLSTPNNNTLLSKDILLEKLTYGVPAPRRMLTPSLLLKKHDYIRAYLVSLGLTTAERDAAFFLLRLYAYYGKVYPKAPNYTEDCYRSKRSFWRAVAKLEEQGIIDRINRYLHHLQISNCYRLDKLVLCLIRYLAEHGCPFLDKFTQDIIRKTANSFWRTIGIIRVRLRDPNPLTLKA